MRITKHLRAIREREAEKGMSRKQAISDQSIAVSLDDELTRDAKEAHKKMVANAEKAVRGESLLS